MCNVYCECAYEKLNVCLCVQHLFALEAHSDLVKAVMEAAAAYVGISVKLRKEPISYEQFQTNRMGKYRSGEILKSSLDYFLEKITVSYTR